MLKMKQCKNLLIVLNNANNFVFKNKIVADMNII